MKHEVELSEEEEKALSVVMVSVQDWLNNAIHNRARQAIDSLIEQNTDRQPKKMSVADKLTEIRKMTVETAVARSARIEAEMR